MDIAKAYVSGSKSPPELEQLNELVIHGYSPMGTVEGGYGTVQVEAREAVMPGRQIVVQSVRIELSSGGDYPQTTFGTISYENMNKFVLALEKIQLTTISRERFSFTEVQFELEGLKIIVFNNDRGALMWALSADALSIHFNSLSKIAELKVLIERAKSHLDDTKI